MPAPKFCARCGFILTTPPVVVTIRPPDVPAVELAVCPSCAESLTRWTQAHRAEPVLSR
jgi:hypothetical protein